LGIDSAFLKKENKLFEMKVKCAACGSKIELFVNTISSAGEVWPFCQKCGTYVDVVPNA
jgi:transposase-like protein